MLLLSCCFFFLWTRLPGEERTYKAGRDPNRVLGPVELAFGLESEEPGRPFVFFPFVEAKISSSWKVAVG